MIIGVDCGALSIQDKRLQLGVYQVTVNLLQQLGKIDKKNKYILYSFIPIEKKLLNSFGPRMQNVVVTPQKGWAKLWLPLQVMKDKPDVFLALSQMPLMFKPKITRVIGFFHDTTFEYFPKMYPNSLLKLQKGSRKLAKQAEHIVAVSIATKKDVIRFYNVSEENISVVYEGLRVLPKSKEKNRYGKYFLYVGALKRQKNIPFLIRSFAKFLSLKGVEDISLILAGADNWLDPEIKSVIDNFSQEVQKRIIFKDFITDAQLVSLLSHAITFVSISLYEGFGLGFLEAMSLGCPIIGSTAGAIPEVVEEAGILIDPHSQKDLIKAMEEMLRYPQKRKILIEKGRKQANKFRWESFALSIFSIIDR